MKKFTWVMKALAATAAFLYWTLKFALLVITFI